MSAEGADGADRRGEPRVPFEGAVRLRYRLFHEFLEENAANISSGGMFIRTIHPGELGSEMEFEVRLDDDFTLIRGKGEVAWVRRPDQVPGADPGMGIRFVSLPEESRALVDRIVSERVAAGLELFDLDSHAPAPEAPVEKPVVAAPKADEGPIWELDGAGEGEEAAVATEPPARQARTEPTPVENLAALDPELPAAPRPPRTPATAPRRPIAGRRSSMGRLLAVGVVSALLGAGAVVTFYLLYVQPSIDALETRIDELAGNPGGPWQPPAEEPEPTEGAGEDETEGAALEALSQPGQNPDVLAAVRGWAAAWSEQRADDYLAYYSAGFVPPDGLGRAAWEESRRARIARPQWIRVALTLVQVESAGPEAAEVSFVQSYRSERYKDLVRKRVRMVLEEGTWKIAAERVVAQ